jgi:methionyl-tRNA formyltransferase
VTVVNDRSPRIVFWGTPEAAAVCLRHLADRSMNITGVVTQPDRPAGRKQVITPPPVKATASKYNIPVLQPESIKTPEFLQQLAVWAADICVVVAYGRIIPATVLDSSKDFINLHFSLLPLYRGAAPVQRALMDGREETGVTVQHMALKLDTGDIILQKRVAVDEEDTTDTLLKKCVESGAPLLHEAIELIILGKAPRIKQNDADATQAHKITRHDGYIDWNNSARQIYNQVRACTPWPGTTTWHAGQAFKIQKARVDNETSSGEKPGRLVPSKKHLKVQTGQGILEILEIQPSNKSSMTAAAFMAGHRMQIEQFEAYDFQK